jgi:glutamate racemase
VQLISTGDAVARQTRQRLGNQLSTQQEMSAVEFISTGNPAALRGATNAWLGLTSDIKMPLIQ